VRWILVAGAVAGLLGVALGAFGAHALRGRLSPAELQVWQTAVQYHQWHALALMVLGAIALLRPDWEALRWVAGLMLAGLVLFSGSLYLLCLLGERWLGAVTPVGGGLWLVAWALAAWVFWRAP